MAAPSYTRRLDFWASGARNGDWQILGWEGRQVREPPYFGDSFLSFSMPNGFLLISRSLRLKACQSSFQPAALMKGLSESNAVGGALAGKRPPAYRKEIVFVDVRRLWVLYPLRLRAHVTSRSFLRTAADQRA